MTWPWRPFRPWVVVVLLVGGCCCAVRQHADDRVCAVAAHVLDPMPIAPADGGGAVPPPAGGRPSVPPAPASAVERGASHAAASREGIAPDSDPAVRLASAQEPAPSVARPPRGTRPTLSERLRIPPELPGANAPPIHLPPATASEQERTRATRALYPALPPLGAEPEPPPGPEGRPLTLSDLQRLAAANSPLLRQAAADVEASRGAAIQAGAYPNPNFGYQSDTAGTGGTAGFQGAFIEQTIKTGGKLKLAQAAALMDLRNSEVAFRRARFDLMTAVRTNYFAVLAARETVKVSHALARFADEVYTIQVEQVLAAQAAPYEPLSLRVLALQARGNLLQARNRYTSAWKQLAATLGLPGMPPTALVGRVDMELPVFRYDTALAHVLSRHTDVLTAGNTVQRARYNLRLAQVTPIPDVSLHVAVEKDFSVPPFAVTHSIQLGVPVPIWDRNTGGIMQAQGALLRAVEEEHRVRADLTNRLAAAFETYDSSRQLLEMYRTQILPDQVRAYRGVYERHQQEPANVSFGDVVSAQQTLAGTVTTYVTTLGTALTAVVNVADLLQVDDFFQVRELADSAQCVAPVPDLEHLPGLPCCHPCSPANDPALKGADGRWPPPVPAPTAEPRRSGETPRLTEPTSGADGGPAPAAPTTASGPGTFPRPPRAVPSARAPDVAAPPGPPRAVPAPWEPDPAPRTTAGSIK